MGRAAQRRRPATLARDRDVVLAPVCLHGPFAAGEDLGAADALLAAMRMVVPVNLLGLPAAAVPAGTGPDGLPLGVQIIGPRFGEVLCLDAAAAVEAALGTLTPIDQRIRSAR